MDSSLGQFVPEIVRRLRTVFDPIAVYHFGSSAWGGGAADSDIDLVVVVEDSSLGFYERGAAAQRALRGVAAPVDVQVYTREEFETRAALPVSFERTVRSKGRLVYAA